VVWLQHGRYPSDRAPEHAHQQRDHEGYEEDEEILLEIANALADDPFSVYHVVDLTIEKKLNSKRRQGKEAKPGKAISPEYLALSLSKRVAPLLAEIVKE